MLNLQFRENIGYRNEKEDDDVLRGRIEWGKRERVTKEGNGYDQKNQVIHPAIYGILFDVSMGSAARDCGK